MELTPDQVIFFEWGPVAFNATLLFTLIVDLVLIGGSWWITRHLSGAAEVPNRPQSVLEALVDVISNQLAEIVQDDPRRYLPFIGTLFLFIAMSNLLAVLPYFTPPTGSLSTTTALAGAVFLAVPAYGIADRGLKGYFRLYIEPSPFMLPFNIIGELSRTMALSVRLFGNMMSGSLLVLLLLALAPLFFPVLMNLFGLLMGMIQAYIFAVLAAVYIASGVRSREERQKRIDGGGGRAGDAA